MNPRRRQWLLRLAAVAGGGVAAGRARSATPPPPAAPAAAVDPVRRGRPLVFPRDHGAHLGVRTEWWYATGWLQDAGRAARYAKVGSTPADAGTVITAAAALPAPAYGFQVTFFRSRTGLASALPGRFAPRQLLFAHAAVTDIAGRRHLHDQRIVRWSEDAAATTGRAALADASVHIGDWRLQRDGGSADWQTRLAARDFGLELALALRQPLLLQGDAGFSRKGPQERQASHYYSEPQLAASGRITLAGAGRNVAGGAWLDHEWSDEILHPEAVGWDWIGMNLFDGSALTAFVLRRRDGGALWAGGSFRAPPAAGAAAAARSFGPQELRWQPGRAWRSPASGASYPVEWQVHTPAGAFGVRALLDAQELDSRASTGSVYWEGLSELLDASGRRVGLGYLEMTGYAGALRMA